MNAFFSDISLKRLLLALVASALMHVMLLGNLRIPLPAFMGKPKAIDVRLVQAQAKDTAVPAAEPVVEIAEPSIEPSVESVIEPSIEPPPPALEEPAPTEPVAATPEPIQTTEVVAPVEEISAETPEGNPEEVFAEEESDVLPYLRKNRNFGNSKSLSTTEETVKQINLNESANPRAYTFVLTEFDVFRNAAKSRVGTAKIEFRQLGSTYQLNSQIEAVGFASLLYPKLTQTSEGSITTKGLVPNHYAYDFGGKADKSSQADFDWSNQKAILRSSKGEKIENIAEGTQDFLSFMYQFMYMPPLNNMQIVMTNGKKIDTYDYHFVGEEVLNLTFGQIKTFHIGRDSVKSDEKTELWLALDYQFLPVKIRKTEKDGSVIEQVATGITTQDATDIPNKNPTEPTPTETKK